MPTDAGNPDDRGRSVSSTFILELAVVGLVVVGLSALTVAVYLFIQNGKRAEKVAQEQVPPRPPTVVVATKATPIVPEPAPAPEPAAVEKTVDQKPDNSLVELVKIEAELAKARAARTKADLMAWVAENATRLIDSSGRLLASQNQKLDDSKKQIQQFKAQIDQRAMGLADDIARLELAQESAAAQYEAAKNRKGYSILPYRGPNGTWHRPVPIECSRDQAQIMPGGPSFRLIDLELSGVSRTSVFSRIIDLAMRRAASQATPDGNAPTIYVLFVVRPSGIKAYYEARARLQAIGVAFGYELVDEKTPIDYPDLGDLTEWPGYQPPPATPVADGELPPMIAANGTGIGGTGNGYGVGQGTGNGIANAIGNGVGRGTGNATGTGIANGTGNGMANGNGSPGGGSGAGSVNQDGLFVWNNGLGGSRSPEGMNTETGSANRGVGGPGMGGSSGRSPRVDFGPGTLSQLGRSRGGSPDLNPPWGRNPDPRRPAAGTGSGLGTGTGGGQALGSSPGTGSGLGTGSGANTAANSGQGQGTGSSPANGNIGTFDDLMAEMKSQGRDGMGRLNGRPGAVPILPGDLADDDAGTGHPASGQPGTSPNRSGTMPSGVSGSNSGSPFARNSPGLPKFESVAESSNNGTGNSSSNAGQTGSSGEIASGMNATQSPNSSSGGSGRPMPGSPGSGSQADDPEENQSGFRSAIRRMFNPKEQLPEKAWEVSLYCDADGVTIRPGEHRLRTIDMNADPDLLPRTLQAMFEKHVRDQPERYWRPYIRYRIGPGGNQMMNVCQSQLAVGQVHWPAIQQPAEARR